MCIFNITIERRIKEIEREWEWIRLDKNYIIDLITCIFGGKIDLMPLKKSYCKMINFIIFNLLIFTSILKCVFTSHSKAHF